MIKEKFESIVEKQISDQDYKTIELVVQYHPCTPETEGDCAVANLCKQYGMRIIKDMRETVMQARQILEKVRQMEIKINNLKKDYRELKEATENESN